LGKEGRYFETISAYYTKQGSDGKGGRKGNYMQNGIFVAKIHYAYVTNKAY